MTQHVLILDDNADNRKLLFFALMSGDYIIYQAEMGGELDSILEKAPRIDLALLDVELPDADGIELGGKLRKQMPDMRLIMLSANDNIEQLEKARTIGADAYVVKPFNLPQVLKFIREMESSPANASTDMKVL